jgi:hypothetical protein
MSKRGNGEGSITRRQDGSYMARYTVQTARGPKRKAIYGKKREDVAAKLEKAIAARDGGVAFDAENLTLGEYLERWLEGSGRNSVKVRTYESYVARKSSMAALITPRTRCSSPDSPRRSASSELRRPATSPARRAVSSCSSTGNSKIRSMISCS